MTEKLLQFIWQHQYFNHNELTTEAGESVSILRQGTVNNNQGPDFLEATIAIGNTKWVGHVELHVKSSDWHKHQHAADLHYANVILHVVWEHDSDINDANGAIIPVIVLHNRVPKLLLNRYSEMMLASSIPCQNSQYPALHHLGWMAWKERLLAERLERKAHQVLQFYEQTNHHWEEVFWWMLAGNFGMKVNKHLFEAVAQSITVNILAKHKHQIHQLEALLMGQAHLLEDDFTEDYPKMLQKEYRFLQSKYKLQPVPALPVYLRMRPANLPTVRLAQLAMLVHQSTHLFATVKTLQSANDVFKFFTIIANDYWHYHYSFKSISDYQPKTLGNDMIHNIIINTLAPVLFAYGLYHKDEAMKEKAIQWLNDVPWEKNTITQHWRALGQKVNTAFDSQALIELTNNYCNQKRCLACAVGNKILRSANE